MYRKRSRKRDIYPVTDLPPSEARRGIAEIGQCVREIREACGLSLRSLADQSGLSVNTLSLIENSKTSPSVSTLQKISRALNVPLIAFFMPEREVQEIVYTRVGERYTAAFESGAWEDLGEGLSSGVINPFVVTLNPRAASGDHPIVHEGYEFVYCLRGRIAYIVEDHRYVLEPGDSLFFEARLPHGWENLSHDEAQKILVLCPGDGRSWTVEQHFSTP